MKLTFKSLCEPVFIHFRRRGMKRFFPLFNPSPEIRVFGLTKSCMAVRGFNGIPISEEL
jgi:hypothetical protein